MDRNTILAFALSIAVYSIWLGYQATLEPPPQPIDAMQQVVTQAENPESGGIDASVNQVRQSRSEFAPAEPPTTRDPAQFEEIAPWEVAIEGQRFIAELTNRGGALTRWTLVDFTELDHAGNKGDRIELLSLDEQNPRALEMAFEELGFGDLGSAAYEVESALPDRVVIFRLPILWMCRTEQEVVREVRDTVVHELGHYFGLSDEDMPY